MRDEQEGGGKSTLPARPLPKTRQRRVNRADALAHGPGKPHTVASHLRAAAQRAAPMQPPRRARPRDADGGTDHRPRARVSGLQAHPWAVPRCRDRGLASHGLRGAAPRRAVAASGRRSWDREIRTTAALAGAAAATTTA